MAERIERHVILIDYENVKPDDLSELHSEQFEAFVFVGKTQGCIPMRFANSLQKMGFRGHYVCVADSGKDALDFHIAFYIGQQVHADPNRQFYIVSNDRGYDPLIKHLKSLRIAARRVKCLSEIFNHKSVPSSSTKNVKSTEERLAALIDRLSKSESSKPGTERSLRNKIKSDLRFDSDDSDTESVIGELKRRNVIRISDKGKVSYPGN